LPSADPNALVAGGVIYLELDKPFEIRKKVGIMDFESLTQQLGTTVQKNLNQHQYAARFGDYAFCLLVPDQDRSSLKRLSEKILEKIADQAYPLEHNNLQVSASIGICPLSREIKDANQVISFAERACNRSAGQSSSRVELHKAKVNHEKEHAKAIGEALVHALRNQGLQVLFRPLVTFDGNTHKVQYQTSLSLPQEDQDDFHANEFLPIAKRIGVLRIVDKWLTAQALNIVYKQAKSKKPIGLLIRHSMDAFAHPGFNNWLGKAFKVRQSSLKDIVIILDWSEVKKHREQAIAYAKKLQALQARLGLSGFDGSDEAYEIIKPLHSSVIELPNAIKTAAPLSLGAHLKSVVNRLQEMGQQVIAPGVEDAASAMRLWAAGVDFIQGDFVQPASNELSDQFSEQ